MKNKKALITFLFTLVIIILLFFIFFFTQKSEVGYIIEKTEDRIWVVQDKKDIEGSTRKKPSEIGGVYYETKRILPFIKNRLKEGQKVKVYSDGVMYASLPGKDEATFIIILGK